MKVHFVAAYDRISFCAAWPYSESDAIRPFRFSLIYGKNAAVRGLDIGLVNAIRNGEFLPVFPFVNFSF